ncbi:MAG: helix-turn-helix domain-containing protein [Actinobacteria bacterium]|nr:helix-turn-helix domain-containing protein [Actinomycetota bacterium]
MAVPRSTPTTRQRELAERLRELRTAVGLTVDAVAEALLVSASKISRIETASRRASPRDVRDLCLLYRVPTDERDRLMALAAQALETTWYQDADIDAVYGTFIGLEEAASAIDTFQNLIAPGLLQTPEYARALLNGLRPRGRLSADRIEEYLAVRVRRQGILTRSDPPSLHAVLDEGALTRPIGDATVMTGQIDRLIESTDLPHVTVQVVPVGAGSHPGLDGRFSVLHFADQVVRDTVYIEGLLGELFLDKESDVDRYQEIFRFLADDVALDPTRSRALLVDIRNSWRR